jgi:oxygen-independent coproporphyrinogen-3 oxidase
MGDLRDELASRMRRPQRHRLLNGYPAAPLMLETPRPLAFLDAGEHDHHRPLIIGILPHTFCNPVRRGCGFCTFPLERFAAAKAQATTRAVADEITAAVRCVPALGQRSVPAVYLGPDAAGGRPPAPRPDLTAAGMFYADAPRPLP